MEEDDAMLSAGFAIDTQGAFSELQRFYQFFDAGTIRVLDEIRRVERATGGMMNLPAATRDMGAFGAASKRELASVVQAAEGAAAGVASLAGAISTSGSAATREARTAARERAQVNKEIEKTIALTQRETAALVQSKEEARAAKVERLSLAAAGFGNTDGADRLLFAERQRQIALENRAQEQAEAASRAAIQAANERARAEVLVNAQLMERARLDDLLERNFGVNRMSAAQGGATFSALATREREAELAEKAAAAERELSVATARQNSLLAERAQIEAALERNTGLGRSRATDAGATFSALAARAAEEEATAVREAAFAYNQFEAAARRGAAAHRETEAAAARDAEALARLRAMIDPAAAAQDRLNAELAEARRVMTAAGASAQELAAAEDALWARSARATQQHDLMAGSARRSGFALQNIALQLPDITQGLLTGQKPMTIFIQQGFQIVQVAQMAEGGLRGFGKEVAGLALRFAPALAVLAVATAGFALFNRWVNEGVTNDQLTRDLGKITGGANATKEELFKLRDETVTWGDTTKALFSVIGKDIAEALVGDMKRMSKDVKSVLDDLTGYGKIALAGLYASAAGTRAYLSEVGKGGIGGLGKMIIGQGDPDLLKKTYGAAYKEADEYLTKLGARVRKEAIGNARERIAKSIGYNSIPEPKTDRRAEQLAREAEATEAQIRNLYKLADAYGVSGAAALIAEARVKAESAAIRKRADVEEFVERQIRLSVAERVKTSAQGAAAMREEAILQEHINAQVAAGVVPAYDAAELMRARMADLPLLSALEAAHTLKGEEGARAVTAATKALEDQRAAQDRVTDAQRKAQLQLAQANSDDQLAYQREELRLIGATEAARVHAMATLRAEQQASQKNWTGPDADKWIATQVAIADGQYQLKLQTDAVNDSLSYQAKLLDAIAGNVSNAARGMAEAFGDVGRAMGDSASAFAGYLAQQERLRATRQDELDRAKEITDAEKRTRREREINGLFAVRTATAQVGLYGDLASAARGFFKEDSDGYKAATKAVQAFRAVEFALSVRAIAQDAVETGSSIAKSVARTAVSATEAVVNAIKSLPFPLNLAAGAATAGAIAALGVSVAGSFGGGNKLPSSNTGTGTVLGDGEAKSESIKRAIDGLREIDTLMLSSSREMASLLRSIDSQIGGVAALVVRAGDVNASGGVAEGFKTNAVGSVLKAIVPVFGGALASLFGTKTTVVGSGLSGGPQTLGSILNDGFDADYYSDVKKKKKLFGITTSTKYSTRYTDADAALENQFTLILRDFSSAIAAAAGPLGASTDEIQRRLNGFVVNIGKIDLQGLTGEQIQEKLSAVFGAAADKMALAAFPGFERFQKVGEGAFETLVRVASTVEAVTASLDMLGGAAQSLGIDAKLGLADQFDSVGDFNSAANAYFEAFYSKEEQAAAKTAQFAKVFDSLGLAMPDTLAGFRSLVDAQNLTTAAGQSTYATLLQLAPAFVDLKSAMDGAKSAADILAERQDLERKILELNGDTAAIRALDLAKIDASNRALQQQVWAIEDAQKAADAAKQLSEAWTSVGDSINDEIKRIRGLSDASGETGFAAAMSQFNAATIAARGGDQDAARLLPGLSQALLKVAADNATSRQELDRIQAQTAASLEQTSAVIAAIAAGNPLSPPATAQAGANPGTKVAQDAALLKVVSTAQPAVVPRPLDNTAADEVRSLRAELAQLRADNNAGHAANAAANNKTASILDRVTAQSGGDAISTELAA